MILWGIPLVSNSPIDPSYHEEIDRWLSKCSDAGVSRIIGGDGTRVLTELANLKDIDVHPYLGCTAFPRHGRSKIDYLWSMEFLRPSLDMPLARDILDDHRPVWDAPKVSTTITDFAALHPEYRSLTRDRSYILQKGQDLYLSLDFPEVRKELTSRFLEKLNQTDATGIQFEFVLGDEDKNGVVTYGYEDNLVRQFQANHGRSPFEIPNDDPDWVKFRAGYVTRYLVELSKEIKERQPETVFSTTIIAGEPGDYINGLQDWQEWINQDAIDEFHLWFRTNSNLGDLERHMKHIVEVIDGRCDIVAELSCYHPGSFQDPGLLLEAGQVAKASGADKVGVYKNQAVEQLGLWDVVEKLSLLN